jgi:hypothetical protein
MHQRRVIAHQNNTVRIETGTTAWPLSSSRWFGLLAFAISSAEASEVDSGLTSEGVEVPNLSRRWRRFGWERGRGFSAGVRGIGKRKC